MKAKENFPKMHLSLYVSNLKKTLEFYSLFFGQDPAKIKEGYAKFHLQEPSLVISFIENPEKVNNSFGHLGFQVQTLEELGVKHSEARKNGLIAKEEIGVNCCYARQDKFWAYDPDGIPWEVYYFHEDTELNDDEKTSQDNCCVETTESKDQNTEACCCDC